MKTNILVLLLLFISLASKAQELPTQEEQKLNKAIAFLSNYNLDAAEVELKALLKPEIKKSQPDVYIRASLNLGRLYGDKGKNVIALKYYQDALKTAEKIGDKASVPHILKNIGVLYVSWKKFDEAFTYYDRAEKLATELGNSELVADCQNNKGIVYEQQEEYSKALSAYKNALELYTKKDVPGKISMALSNIAIVYKYQKNYNEAIDYNLKAIAISERQGDKWSMAATYNNIGNLYGEIENYKNAIAYCEKALAIAQEIDAQEIIWSIYDSMANAAEKAGNYKKAYQYHKLFSESMSKFINKENTKQLSELNIKYETEKKQNQINQQEFELRQKNNWLLFSGILFFAAFISAYFIYKNYQSRQAKKLQDEIFRQKEVETKALFEGEQKERIRIARDLHDSVGQMLSLVKMKLSSQEQNTEIEKTQELVDKTISEVRNISHNLIPEELNFGLLPALENLADRVNASSKVNMELDVSEAIKQLQFLKQNELSIYRIVQEVVNNMVKHAEASLIDLSIEKIERNIIIAIKDNGKGFDKDLMSKSSGIGWKNINARIHMMDGTIKVESEKRAGTQIKIILPQHG